jgi:hypothetical protein
MGRHILVINRFANESGRYHRYIDHRADSVSYITTRSGAEAIDDRIAESVVVVPDLSDWAHVRTCAQGIEARHGRVDVVLALSEYDLDLGASLRELLGVEGPRPADVRRVRDKVTMKSLVAQAGLRVPRFVTVDDADSVRRFAEAVQLPVILKPRTGWDSQGVYLVKSAAGLEKVLSDPSLDGYECEEFVDGRMYHVDGIVKDGSVRALRSSRLLGSCLDFALGSPFGSVANDDEDLERRFAGYAERIAAALGMGTSAFHLEVFRTAPAGPGEHDDLVFLEVGARVGGAQIPFVWREVYGVDLFEAWVRMLLGESPALPRVDVTSEAGGYLLMPEPPVRPCRVRRATSLADRIPEVYAEVVPTPGAILDGTGGAKETAGHYRFRAPTSAQVEAAIHRAMAAYELEWEPAGERSAGSARTDGRAQPLVCA